METKEIFCKNLQYYMELRGISRNDLCNALGYKYSTVSEWLQGNKTPRIDKVSAIAKYLDISIGNLCYEHRYLTMTDFRLSDAFEELSALSEELEEKDKEMLLKTTLQTIEMFKRLK